MCQPGRPSPQGAGQAVSSPSLRAFQSAKSCGLSFSVRGVVALSLLHLLPRAVGELAVAVEARHAEVHVAARGVGVAALDEGGDQVDDRPDRLRRARLVVGPAEAEAVGVALVVRGHLPGELLARDPGLAGGVVDLVVHVGDVLDQGHLVALVLEEALEQREDHERTRVAHVHPPVDGRAARVDAHLPRLAGLERRSSPLSVSWRRTSRTCGRLRDPRAATRPAGGDPPTAAPPRSARPGRAACPRRSGGRRGWHRSGSPAAVEPAGIDSRGLARAVPGCREGIGAHHPEHGAGGAQALPLGRPDGGLRGGGREQHVVVLEQRG